MSTLIGSVSKTSPLGVYKDWVSCFKAVILGQLNQSGLKTPYIVLFLITKGWVLKYIAEILPKK